MDKYPKEWKAKRKLWRSRKVSRKAIKGHLLCLDNLTNSIIKSSVKTRIVNEKLEEWIDTNNVRKPRNYVLVDIVYIIIVIVIQWTSVLQISFRNLLRRALSPEWYGSVDPLYPWTVDSYLWGRLARRCTERLVSRHVQCFTVRQGCAKTIIGFTLLIDYDSGYTACL